MPEEQKQSLLKKLYNLEQEVKAIEKDSDNPYFKSKYFDINKIISVLKPLLKKHELAIFQPIELIDGKNVLKTIITDIESGDKLESTISLPDNLEPQKMGSAITYLRRYSLQSMLFLEAEDDDGSLASPQNITKGQARNNNNVADVPFN